MTFYRYEPINDRITLYEFNLIEETSKGYWIGRLTTKQWIPKESKKRFAYPTKEEALINLITRTKRRISILESQLRHSKNTLRLSFEI